MLSVLSVVAGPSYKNSLQNLIQGSGKGLERPDYDPIPQLNGTLRLITACRFSC